MTGLQSASHVSGHLRALAASQWKKLPKLTVDLPKTHSSYSPQQKIASYLSLCSKPMAVRKVKTANTPSIHLRIGCFLQCYSYSSSLKVKTASKRTVILNLWRKQRLRYCMKFRCAWTFWQVKSIASCLALESPLTQDISTCLFTVTSHSMSTMFGVLMIILLAVSN